MAAEDLRAHHCPTSSALPSPSPAKPHRSTSASEDQAHPRRPSPPSPAKPFRGNSKNSGRNRATPSPSGRRSGSPGSRRPTVARSPAKMLVVGELTILKRGEVVKDPDPVAAGGCDLDLCSTERLGPDPETLPKQMRLVERGTSLFAGGGFVESPLPSSLPFPASFFAKKNGGNKMDLATKGLRYLLRLDLA